MDVHEKNLAHFIQVIFNKQVTSRAEIAKELGLTKATVSSLYEELKTTNLVIEVGQGESTKIGGRRPVLIRINPQYGYILSFDIGQKELKVMANYLNGEKISFQKIELEKNNFEETITTIKKIIEQTVITSTDKGLLGIGISAHGIVNNNQIVDLPFMEYTGQNLAAILEEKYKIPVYIENEANASAIYERDFITHNRYSNMLVLSIHRGIGAGLINNGRIYRGSQGMAGEIGRSLFISSQGKVEKIENTGSQTALLEQVEKVSGKKGLKVSDVAGIIQVDNNVKKVVQEYTKILATVVYNAIVMYDAEYLALSAELLIQIPEIYQEIVAQVKNFGLNVPIKIVKNTDESQLYGVFSRVCHKILNLEAEQINFFVDEKG